MFSFLLPDNYVHSVYELDFIQLYDRGYRALLFDVDNTLVPHNAPADENAVLFFEKLHSIGFKTAFISNNKEPRVKLFCESVNGTSYRFKSNKPSTAAYLSILKEFGISKENAIFFGDQIFTDILGAKKSKIKSVLVEPVLKWKEEPQIILKRFFEAFILLFYNKDKETPLA